MKDFGIVLPSWLYKPERVALAQRAFTTLIRTQVGSVKPYLLVLTRDAWNLNLEGIDNTFRVDIRNCTEAAGTEQTLAYGTQLLFDMGHSHVIWLGDDALFHTMWLFELNALINRHPEAFSWTVYRSAYEKFHTPVGDDGTDIETQCLCGHGLTFSAEEWKTWGIDWHTGHWPSPAGDTLDLHHSWVRQPVGRPGGRWCTRRSFIEHTGRTGVHCTGVEPEYAQDFVGTGE